jgi:hypothetical protein
MKNETSNAPLDLSQSKPMEAKNSRRGKISVCIVNTTSNGKRIKLSRELMEKLDNPSEIQFRILDEKIVIGSNLDVNEESFKFSKTAVGTIYNSSIVANFTEVLHLDFANVTSITLSNIKFRKGETKDGEIISVAVVKGNL